MAKTANVFGATGLTGKMLTERLIADNRYALTRIFVRRDVGTYLNSETIKVDVENLWKIESLISGNEVFCCLGTTIRQAGSKEAFRKTDLELVVRIAEYARANGVSHFLVISALGADPASKNFYLRTKGEMEEALKKIGFPRLSILRPSLLLGPRKESRIGETVAKVLMKVFSPFMLGGWKKYKAIHASTVASAMIAIANTDLKQTVYESDELEQLGKD